MTEISVGEGTSVTLFFSLSLENGDIVDSNFEAKPATFTVGDGSLLPGFEQALFGLKSGAKEQIVIPPEKGFGQPNPNNIQSVDRESFAEMELAEGLVVSFADPAGGELPGVIASFDEQEVQVDFNHPLAGRSIVFEVEILSVEPAVTH